MNAAQDAAGYAVGAVVNYNGAKRDAAEMREELNRTRVDLSRAVALERENDRLRSMLQFTRANPQLTWIPASVLQRSKGMLTIDVGSLHGVQPSMCAITKDGIVGIVTRVEPTMSYVASLHHELCSIESHTGQRRVWGVVRGTGNDINQICRVDYIDLKDHVLPGDEVVSAGGGVYPAELPIGFVLRVRKQGDLLQAADVEPYADPYAVKELLLVRAALPRPTDMAALDQPPLPFTLPDDRPLQERFAP
jgi:rod shape-determining protein MreC